MPERWYGKSQIEYILMNQQYVGGQTASNKAIKEINAGDVTC